MIGRGDRVALALAGGCAVLLPLALLVPHGSSAPTTAGRADAPLAAPEIPAASAAYERPLFGAVAGGEEAALPADAPHLLGVVGRLGADAVALVRAADGTSRTLRPGDSIDGWLLASLAIDAAYFTRGGNSVRVPLPAGDGE
ncbi:hypothetical protein ACG3SL_11805 [Sphingomonas sp. CJ20]